MSCIILLFGITILLSGAMIVVKPEPIFKLLRSHSESLGLHVFAVVIRLVVGISLLAYAGDAKFPVALQVFGWLAVIAAIILGVIGRSRFKSLIAWTVSFTSPFVRFAGLFAILLGAFLIYAVT